MYDNGQGVTQNDGKAVKWYQKAADQGLAGGQFLLGTMYANGQGVTQDDGEAVKWYQKAVDQGHVRVFTGSSSERILREECRIYGEMEDEMGWKEVEYEAGSRERGMTCKW